MDPHHDMGDLSTQPPTDGMRRLPPPPGRLTPRPNPSSPAARRAAQDGAGCDAFADGSGRLAVLHAGWDGRSERVSFDALRTASGRLAQLLWRRGLRRGARVAVLLPPGPDALVVHLAAFRIGAISAPLARDLRPEVLAARLRGLGCTALVADAAGLAGLAAARDEAALPVVAFCTDGAAPGAPCLWQSMAATAPEALPPPPGLQAAALILHDPSGGGARAVLHAHRAIDARRTALRMLLGGAPAPGQLLWSPGSWSGQGGLLDVVLPALSLGLPLQTDAVDAFDPVRALRLLARGEVRHAILPAAVLRRLRDATAGIRPVHRLLAIGSFDSRIEPELLNWAQDAFGLPVTLAEASAEAGAVAVGGRPVPGRRLVALGRDRHVLPDGHDGAIALRRPDPGLFLGYWRDPAASAARLARRWCLTGLRGSVDAAGLPRPAPAEARRSDAETCLREHPAVARAAVIRTPGAHDATAIVIPRPDATPGPALATELRGFLRERLATEDCPHRIGFAGCLPEDLSGPAQRHALEGVTGLGAGA